MHIRADDHIVSRSEQTERIEIKNIVVHHHDLAPQLVKRRLDNEELQQVQARGQSHPQGAVD